MKTAAQLVCSSLAAAVLAASGCNYVKPVMYIDVANHSGHAMENLEVTHPSGTFGMPELRDEQTHQHLTPIATPCQFSIKFQDQSGKKYAGTYDLGAKCPTEVSFDVGPGMSVSARLVRP
jgi:hypothetical protein